MGIYAFAISIFFISLAIIFGMCINYQSAASIGIRIVLYFKRTLGLLICTLILMFFYLLGLGNNLVIKTLLCKFMVYLWYRCSKFLMTFHNNVPHDFTSSNHKYFTNNINGKWPPLGRWLRNMENLGQNSNRNGREVGQKH